MERLTLGERLRRLLDSGQAGLAGLGDTLAGGAELYERYSPLQNLLRVTMPEADKREKEMAEKVRGWLKDTERANTPAHRGTFSERLRTEPFQAIAESGARTLPSLTATLAATAVNPLLGVGMGAGMGGVESYESAREHGAGEGKSLLIGAGVGGAQGLLERVGAGSILRGKGGALARAGRGALGEGLTETAQETLAIGGDLLAGGTLEGAGDRLLESGIAGAGLGGGTALAFNSNPTTPTDPYRSHRPEAMTRGQKTVERVKSAFRPRGDLPEPIFEAKQRADWNTRSLAIRSGAVAKQVDALRNDYLQKNPNVDALAFDHQLHEYLTGEASFDAHPDLFKDIDPQLLEGIDRVRGDIDTKTETMRQLPDLLTDEQRATLDGGKGQYARRSFQVHTDPAWLDKVRDTPTWGKAFNHLKSTWEPDGIRRAEAVHLRRQQGEALKLLRSTAKNDYKAAKQGIREQYEADKFTAHERAKQERVELRKQWLGRKEQISQETGARLLDARREWEANPAGRSWSAVRAELIAAARAEASAELAARRGDINARADEMLGEVQGDMRSRMSELEVGRDAMMAQAKEEAGTLPLAETGPLKADRMTAYLEWLPEATRQRVESGEVDFWEAVDAWKAKSITGLMQVMADHDPSIFSDRGYGVLGSIDRSILTGRKDIDQPILELMGQRKDVATVYLDTVTRMNRTIERHKLYSAIKEGGLEDVFWKAPTEGYYRKVKSMSGQLGEDIYTSKSLAQALDEGFDGAHKPGVFRHANGIVKMNKTVLSVMGQSRNFLANNLYLTANGNSPLGVFDAYKSLGSAVLGKGGETDAVKLLADGAKHGLVQTSVDVGTLKSYLGDLSVASAGDNMVLRAGKRGLGAAQGLYEATDAVAKLTAWAAETKKYQAALGDSVPLEQVKSMTSEIVRNTMQNYDMLSPVVHWFRRSPAIGPFVPFPSEVIRNGKNIVQLGFKEMSDPNPGVRLIGARRLGGLAGTLAVPAGMSMLAKGLADAGFDAVEGVSEWDEEMDSAVREFLPEWSENAEIVPLRIKDGKAYVVDMGFLDPWSYLKRPFMASMRAGEIDENEWSAAAEEAAAPFAARELLVSTLIDIDRGRDSSGRVIYKETDSALKKVRASANHVLSASLPGFADSGRRIWRAVRSGDRTKILAEVTAVGGPRITAVDPRKAMPFEVWRWKDLKQATAREAAQMPAEESLPQLMDLYSKLQRKYEASIKVGLSADDTGLVMRTSGISKNDLQIVKMLSSGDQARAEKWVRSAHLDYLSRKSDKALDMLQTWRKLNPQASRQEELREIKRIQRIYPSADL